MVTRFANTTELASRLQRQLRSDSADLAVEMASAWLSGATKLTPWPPVDIPADLWAWHLELAGLIYDNPHGAERVTFGRLTISWGVAARDRAAAILDLARTTYGGEAATGPTGSFPAAECYPDPAMASLWRPVP